MKTQLEPKSLYWAQFNSIQFRMPGEAVADCSHSGQCDDDVAYWAPKIRKLTDQLYADDPSNSWKPTPAKIRAELKETGAWDADELQDDEQNWHRLIWIAAGNISDEENPDCSEPVK